MPKIKHLGLKIASLLCGISLWFFVVAEREFNIYTELPLRFTHLPAQLAISSRPPTQVPVQLSGKAIDLIRLRASDSVAWMEIDLRNATLGQQTVSLTDMKFQAPGFENIQVLNTQGLAAIDFEVDTRIQKRIPIKFHAELEAAPGYAIVGTPSISPQEIVISGARNILTRVFEIPTVSENITGLKWDHALPIALDFSGLPSHVNIQDSLVQIRVRVEPLERRIFTGVTVQLIGNFDRSIYSLSPATATIEITGGKNVFAKTQQSHILLFIEHSRFAIEDADSLSPTVRVRQPVQSWQVHPEKFHLKTRSLPLPLKQGTPIEMEGTL